MLALMLLSAACDIWGVLCVEDYHMMCEGDLDRALLMTGPMEGHQTGQDGFPHPRRLCDNAHNVHTENISYWPGFETYVRIYGILWGLIDRCLPSISEHQDNFGNVQYVYIKYSLLRN